MDTKKIVEARAGFNLDKMVVNASMPVLFSGLLKWRKIMSAKKVIGRVIGYGLTALIAFWGIVYVPCQCIKAVEPYSGKNVFDAFNALGGTPLVSPIMIVVATLGACFFPWFASPKVMFFTVVWGMSLFGPLVTVGQRDVFLSKQVVWTGSCNISQVVFADSPIVKLSCENGQTIKTRDMELVNELIRGTQVLTCKLNAAGYADCKPKVRQ